jgi:hypothetical protein
MHNILAAVLFVAIVAMSIFGYGEYQDIKTRWDKNLENEIRRTERLMELINNSTQSMQDQTRSINSMEYILKNSSNFELSGTLEKIDRRLESIEATDKIQTKAMQLLLVKIDSFYMKKSVGK